jgi:hypothetical protein
MKKAFVTLFVTLAIVAPVFAHSQTVDISTMSPDQIRIYIISLIEQVIALENQLMALQNSSSTVEAPLPPEISAASTTGVGGGTGTETVTTPSLPIMESKTISLTVATSGHDVFVTITNDTGVAVRVKNLNVPDGVLAGVTIGGVYGQGIVYAASFTDNLGKSFGVLSCDGLGSLGDAILPGGKIDPCRRKDANLARNELQPGERMILRYTGTPTSATYQAGSIVEVATGNDVLF